MVRVDQDRGQFLDGLGHGLGLEIHDDVFFPDEISQALAVVVHLARAAQGEPGHERPDNLVDHDDGQYDRGKQRQRLGRHFGERGVTF